MLFNSEMQSEHPSGSCRGAGANNAAVRKWGHEQLPVWGAGSKLA